MPPPKKPTALTLVQGNPGKRAINKNEPKPMNGHKPAPDYFTEQQVHWYNELVKDLELMGVMTIVDSTAAEMLVEAYAEYRQLSKIIDEEGFTYTTQSATGGTLIKGHPAVNMRSNAFNRLRGMLQEFGLTPAARSKVEAHETSDDDILSDLMKRSK